MDEFALIRRYFDRRLSADGVVCGIGDDGAIVRPSSNTDQIQVIDSLVESVHFPADMCPADIAFRAVAVNLSDLAAMGARPRWMTLALTLPRANDDWLRDFAHGLFEAADEFDVALIGGDTTKGRDCVVTVALSGEVPRGESMLRSGAQPGDTVFVSGTLGDAGAGLAAMQSGVTDGFLVSRFCRPQARVALGRALLGRASAAIDVSDGLIGDLGKLLSASNVGARIDLEKIPISDALADYCVREKQLAFAMHAGDDYELCFAARPEFVSDVDGITAIGEITAGTEFTATRNGQIVTLEDSGYRHFK